MNWKKTAFWIIAVIITISTAVYQRMTGPTYPREFSFNDEGTEYKFSLPRSQNGYKDAVISLEIEDLSVSGELMYRKYKSGDSFDTIRYGKKRKHPSGFAAKTTGSRKA